MTDWEVDASGLNGKIRRHLEKTRAWVVSVPDLVERVLHPTLLPPTVRRPCAPADNFAPQRDDDAQMFHLSHPPGASDSAAARPRPRVPSDQPRAPSVRSGGPRSTPARRRRVSVPSCPPRAPGAQRLQRHDDVAQMDPPDLSAPPAAQRRDNVAQIDPPPTSPLVPSFLDFIFHFPN